MAGHHQIWAMDLERKVVGPYAGDGRETIKDGPLLASRFAQPSGLASDGKFLYVADSEVSAIRKVPMNGRGRVETSAPRGAVVGTIARLDLAAGEHEVARGEFAVGVSADQQDFEGAGGTIAKEDERGGRDRRHRRRFDGHGLV